MNAIDRIGEGGERLRLSRLGKIAREIKQRRTLRDGDFSDDTIARITVGPDLVHALRDRLGNCMNNTLMPACCARCTMAVRSANSRAS